MSEWDERYENHPLQSEVQTYDAILTEVEELASSDPKAVTQVNRLRQVHALLLKQLAAVDPVLVPFSTLKQLHSYVQQQRNELAQFRTNKNVGHLSNANTQADSVLVQLKNLNAVAAPADVEGIRDAVGSFRKSAGQYLRNIEGEYTSLQARLSELNAHIQKASEEVTVQKSRLDAAITQHQQQFSQAEEGRREKFSQVEQERAERFSRALNQVEETTGRAVEDFQLQCETLLQEHNDSLKTVTSTAEKTTAELMASLRDSAAELLKSIEQQKKRAEDLVHVIADTGMVGGYQRVANEEQVVARVWEGVALVALVGLVGFAIYAFRSTLGATFDWGVFLARGFVAVTFAVLAGYAARQAEKHHAIERRNRRVELEIASIGPFLTELPEDERNEVKKNLAERLFGNPDPASTLKGGYAPPPTEVLVEALVKLVAEAKK